MKSPLQSAIEVAVKEAVAPLSAEIAALKKLIKDLPKPTEQEGVTTKELDKEVARALAELTEREIPELVNRAVIQMLATPKRAGNGGSTAAALTGDCPRQPHEGKCPSAWCIRAEKKSHTAEGE